MNQTNLAHPSHPYYPKEAHLDHYVPNDYSVVQLLSIFAAGCVALFGLTKHFVQSLRPTIPTSELAIVLWFVLSGSIHIFFEGYYVSNYKDLASMQTLFAQLWKEYALADSRYLTRDPLVLCLETITAALWGPLCFIVAGLIIKDHSLRHPLQIIVSLGEAYGDSIYYYTNVFDNYVNQVRYSRPEFVYFWGYYFFMNFIWIVVPSVLIYQSGVATSRAFKTLKASKPLDKEGMSFQPEKKTT